jgi:hypothetical protein
MDDAALQFCMREIAALIGAQQAFWCGTVRVGHDGMVNGDPYKGWRLGAWAAMGHTHASSPEWMRSAARAFNASGTRDLSACASNCQIRRGSCRAGCAVTWSFPLCTALPRLRMGTHVSWNMAPDRSP